MDQGTSEHFDRIPDHPLFTVEIDEPEIGLTGYVCIHSMGKYGASGGMRCVRDIEKQEVRLLARAMSYKYSFFNIQQGGAKAGLALDYATPPDQKAQLLQAAARHLEPLVKKQVWSPWTDMNFYQADLKVFMGAIGISRSGSSDGGSSFRTAMSAFAALQAAVEDLGIEPRDVRVTLEGFGSVARFLAPLLKPYGVKLIAVSTHLGAIHNPRGLDIDAILKAQGQGKNWIEQPGPWDHLPREQLFEIETDILIPCARVHSIDESLARGLKTKLIVPIANVPCNDPALAALDERGILYVPDYLVNGGGVCGHIMGDASPERLEAVQRFVERYKPMIKRLLELSRSRDVPARVLSDEVAHRNFAALARESYLTPSLKTKTLQKLQRMGAIPGNPDRKERELRSRKTLDHLEHVFQ